MEIGEHRWGGKCHLHFFTWEISSFRQDGGHYQDVHPRSWVSILFPTEVHKYKKGIGKSMYQIKRHLQSNLNQHRHPSITGTDHEYTIINHVLSFGRKSCYRTSFLWDVLSFYQVRVFTCRCNPEKETHVAFQGHQIWPHSHVWANRTVRYIKFVKGNRDSEPV